MTSLQSKISSKQTELNRLSIDAFCNDNNDNFDTINELEKELNELRKLEE